MLFYTWEYNPLHEPEGHLYIHLSAEYALSGNQSYKTVPVKTGSMVKVPVKLDTLKIMTIRFEK